MKFVIYYKKNVVGKALTMELTLYMKEFLTNLIAIKSTGGDPEEGAPYGKAPREALEYFLTEAQKAGFRTGVTGDRAGWVEFGKGDRLIGIICHLDVVPIGDGWNTDPFTLTVKDDVMYARGIVDDKGPAAASFFAMKELLDEGKEPDNYRVRLILGTDEERSCSCVEYYAQHEEIPSFAITPDSQFPAIYCEKGIIHVKVFGDNKKGLVAQGGSAPNMVPAKAHCVIEGNELNTTGKPAHGSRPELGINAISLLIDEIANHGIDISEYPILRFIRDFDAVAFTGCDTIDESGALTSNIGVLKAEGNESYVILDFRTPYSVNVKDVLGTLKSKAAEYGLDIDPINAMDSIYMDKNAPEILGLTKIWSKHIDKFTGFKEEYRAQYTDAIAVGGGTYARHIPNTVAFGVETPWSEDQCHQANECIPVNDFIEWIEVLKEYITTIS